MLNEELLNLQRTAKRPIPGQSLTNDPNNPAPFEKPPKYTSVHEASEFIFGQLILEENYVPAMRAIAEGVSLMEMTQTLLFTGFSKGYWNPDLMLILIEPVAYMYMALAERAGIDPIIDLNEDEEEDAEEEFFGISKDNEKLKRLQRNLKGNTIPAGVINSEMEEKLEALPTKEEMSLMVEEPVKEKPSMEGSLLAAPTKEEEEQ